MRRTEKVSQLLNHQVYICNGAWITRSCQCLLSEGEDSQQRCRKGFGFVEDINSENEEEDQSFDAKALIGIVTETLSDKEREIQMYQSYHRGDDETQQEGHDCYKVQSTEKKKRKTRLTRDGLRTGKNLRRPHQLVAVNDVGGVKKSWCGCCKQNKVGGR
jgi:hypothetical protein